FSSKEMDTPRNSMAAATSDVRSDGVVVAIFSRVSEFGKTPEVTQNPESRTPSLDPQPSGEVDPDQESCDKEIEHEDPHRSCDHRPRGRASDAFSPAGGAQP